MIGVLARKHVKTWGTDRERRSHVRWRQMQPQAKGCRLSPAARRES